MEFSKIGKRDVTFIREMRVPLHANEYKDAPSKITSPRCAMILGTSCHCQASLTFPVGLKSVFNLAEDLIGGRGQS